MIVRQMREMHRSIVITTRILALVLCTQCRGATEPALGADEMRGRWAEQDWRGDASASLIRSASGDTLYVLGGSPKDTPWYQKTENISIRVVFTGVGTYGIAQSAATMMQLLGGDVTTATYVATGSAGDQLIITEYSAETGTMKGTFQFEASSSDEHRQYGESARFKNGRFSATVGVYQR